MNEDERAELARGIIDANLYMTIATARETFSKRSVAHGGEVWTRARLEPRDRFRLYCATASDYSMIGPEMPRAPVNLPA
jgi:hypothetical protein